MYKNKALIDRTLNTPSDNDNNVMMYRKLISLIERYNMLARDKGLPVKAIPVYNNSVNCSLMIKSVTSILKDIDRVKNIKDTDNDNGNVSEKIKTDVTFDENGAFTEGIWTYGIDKEANGVVIVVLNVDKFSEAFNGDTVALNYDYMPYEKLIDTAGNEYLTPSYMFMFTELPNTVTSLTIDNWTNINVTSMTGLFQECSSLTSLTLGDNFNTSNVTDMARMFSGCSSLTSLTLGDKFDTSNVTNMHSMFSGCSSLTSLTLGDNFNTSKVTDMTGMFSGCSSLTSLTLGDKFDTSNVTNMGYMFIGCSSLTSLTLGDNFIVPDNYTLDFFTGLAPDNACIIYMNETMYNTFKNNELDDYTFSPELWNPEGATVQKITVTPPMYVTAKDVEFTNDVFNDGIWTYKLTGENNIEVTLNVNAFSTQFNGISTVILDYDKMPYERLITTDGTIYSTTSYVDMFSDLPSEVTALTIQDWTNRKVTDMTYMFYDCRKLTSLTLGDKFDTSNVTNMSLMFQECEALESLTLGDNFNTSRVTSMHLTFGRCDKLESVSLYKPAQSLISQLPLGTWSINDTYNTVVLYESNGSDPTWNPTDLPDSWTDAQWTLTRTDKTKRGVIFDENGMFTDGIWTYRLNYNDISVVLDFYAFSDKFGEATTIKLDYGYMPYERLIDTEGNEYIISSYANMFRLLPNTVTSLTIDNWTNMNVMDMGGMFYACSSLTELTLGNNFNTSNVTDMNNTFKECSSLTSLTLGDKFDTSNVTNMGYMFIGCSSLTSLTLGDNFNTSSVVDMDYMFSGCSSLITLMLGDKFDTSTVMFMQSMFSGCTSLRTLVLGINFNVPSDYDNSTMTELAPSNTCKITMNENMYDALKQYDLNGYTFVPNSWDTSGGAVQEITVEPSSS